MSKYIAEQISYKDGDELVISYKVEGYNKAAALRAIEENKGKGKLEIEVKPYKSKRSLEQNRLLWSLLGKMALSIFGSRDMDSTNWCYCIMLEHANAKSEFLLALPETEEYLKKAFRAVRRLDDSREVNGKILNVYQCFIGSSKYNTSEMTELIESVLNKLAELGVDDSEIACARLEYNIRRF